MGIDPDALDGALLPDEEPSQVEAAPPRLVDAAQGAPSGAAAQVVNVTMAAQRAALHVCVAASTAEHHVAALANGHAAAAVEARNAVPVDELATAAAVERSTRQATAQTRVISPTAAPVAALVARPSTQLANTPREEAATPRRRTRTQLPRSLLVAALPIALLVVGLAARRPRPSPPARPDLPTAQVAPREYVTELIQATQTSAPASHADSAHATGSDSAAGAVIIGAMTSSRATPPFEVRFPGSFSFNDASPAVDDAVVAAIVSRIRASCGDDATIAITGHTCNRGQPDINVAIGRARADRVADLLTDAGIDRRRIDIRSAGSREPLASNLTSEGRSLNRRVVIRCQR